MDLRRRRSLILIRCQGISSAIANAKRIGGN
jgi:hypothetical protein